ncbi:hypothetical protein FHT40_004812 [Mycolicibacterium sp. BK556]|uniref:DUF2889 domain-containing protein n=1 Tax=unclassified Mycolicibacterium TaxID=2636767 RepID=UPI001612BB27|nr:MULTISPECIES: DUF2889 domain-containing protein [unclassified Mycolicibacterium]MBB3605128.1 hypothetical protein [Mycolicibacterium sp. BK556]MBB3635324.1 hypothetical protein [Mycolicibacterium sp. BK607]
MPFVTDIVGPQQPVTEWPPLRPGMLRRATTIDTHPQDSHRADAQLRARDTRAGSSGTLEVVDDVVVLARLTDHVIDEISGGDPRLGRLLGARVGGGFRAIVRNLLGSDTTRSPALYLLLDDWVGASLVTGYGAHHADLTGGVEWPMSDAMSDHLAGVCSGFAPDASAVDFSRRNMLMPCVRGPLAPPLGGDGMPPGEPLRPHGMRRMRRLDVSPNGATAAFDAHFRDSHADADGIETVVHEYTVTGEIDVATQSISHLTAEARVLPWQECPGALASAQRIAGMAVADVRDHIRTEFTGISTCTHLNDTLRSLTDAQALLAARAR